MKNIETSVIDIVKNVLGYNNSNINSKTLLSDLGCDDLDKIEIFMTLEKDFEVIYDNEDSILTIDDLIKVITKHKNKIRQNKFKRLGI